MATATKRAKDRPADTCRLTVTVRGTEYTARPVRAETSDVVQAWRLRKADGSVYDVAETTEATSCTCADYVFRHDGKDADGCKHIKALRALGLIEQGVDEGPECWPAWTDGCVFNTAR